MPESATGVDTGIDVFPADRVHVHGSGYVWSGTWLMWPLGPEGDTSLPDNPNYPMALANRYSLLGRFPSDGYFWAGRSNWRNGPSFMQRLDLRTNDDVPGNGSGFFQAEVRVFR